MARMTLEELRKLRASKQNSLQKRSIEGKEGQVIIGMGTCGIAAGAKTVLDAFISELDAKGVTNISVTQTGCMGLCHVEPTIEVIVPNMPDVIYGKVDAEVARQIVQDHIIDHKLVNDHVYDRPAADIYAKDGDK
ncbi:MAG: (2Fe-2S) ferredoxin domain-containing protein [Pleomorphochaeta sp.]